MSSEMKCDGTNPSFDSTSFSKLFDAEDKHFWFLARNHMIKTLVNSLVSSMGPGYKVLEIGCGNGNVLKVLQYTCKNGSVFGVDFFREGLRYAKKRNISNLIQGDIHHLPFKNRFDLICLFDVLEHLQDDESILNNLRELLNDSGYLLLTVPAHPSMWSYSDEAAHHCRRYELEALKEELIRADYFVDYITYYMGIVFPLLWIGRRIKTSSKYRTVNDLAADELRIIPIFNELLTWLLMQEARIIAKRVRSPLGTSIVVVARKNGSPESPRLANCSYID